MFNFKLCRLTNVCLPNEKEYWAALLSVIERSIFDTYFRILCLMAFNVGMHIFKHRRAQPAIFCLL